VSDPAPASRFAEVDGIRLHWLDWEGTGPPVVCLHGLTRNAHDFDALARALAPARRVLALDVRGRGESAWAPAETYQIPRYVADLTAWLDGLALERVALVGTSMGGLVSMFFGAASPERVEATVLNDIGPVIDPRGLERIRGYVGGAPERFDDLESVAAALRTNAPNPWLPEDAFLEAARHATVPLEDGGLGWRYDGAIRAQMREPPTEAVVPPDVWPLAEALPGPTLVVRGGVSDILSAEMAREMTERMKSCSLVEVPDVGHAPALVEPPALGSIRRLLGVA
jgi:pimeloyl-ACP methyl ester carboxylesterase